MPAWRGDTGVRWSSDRARCAAALNTRENGASTHGIAMRARGSGKETNTDGPTMTSNDISDGIGATISPIGVGDIERWLSATDEVGRHIDLKPELLRVSHSAVRPVGLRVRTRNEDASVREEGRLGVVETGDVGGVENRDTMMNWLVRVVEKSLEVGVDTETKASIAVVGSIDDQEGAVRQGGHTGHDTT